MIRQPHHRRGRVPAGARVESIGGDGFSPRSPPGWPAVVPRSSPRSAPMRPRLCSPQSARPERIPLRCPRRDLPTIRNVIRYDDTGGEWEFLVLGEGHFEALSVHPADASDAVLAAPGVLGVGDGAARTARARRRGCATAPRRQSISIRRRIIAGHETALRDAVRGCDVPPSEIEAAALAGTSDLHAAAATFLELGPQAVVMKLAAAGCLVATLQRPRNPPWCQRMSSNRWTAPAPATRSAARFGQHLRNGDAYAAAEAGARAARIAVGGPGVDGLLAAITGVVR